MKLFKVFIASALLAVVTAPAAHAGQKVLASAPAVITGTNNTLFCDATNIDPVNPIDITGDVMDLSGNVVATATKTVQPMTGNFFGSFNAPGAWCRFTFTGSSKNVRAMAVYDDGTTYTVSLPAY